MGLKNLKFPEATIEFSGGDFAVRGLSLNDISWLVQRHGQKLNNLFTQFQQSADELDTATVAAFALPLLQSAPEIAAELIACATGDAEDAEMAAQLPFPVQLDALEKLVELTFSAGGGPKKLVEIVVRLAQGTTGLLAELKAPQA